MYNKHHLIGLLVTASLTACGGAGFEDTTPTPSPTTSETPEPTPEPTPVVSASIDAQDIVLNSERICDEGDTSNTFSEVAVEIGLTYSHVSEDDGMFNQSGGVAAGDFDNDGWVDLYAVGGEGAPSVLLKNQGDGTFEDVASDYDLDFMEKNSGPVFADYNGDGWLDLFIGAVGGTDPIVRNAENRLMRSNGGNSFTDVAEQAGLLVDGNTVSASFGDADNDGDLDLLMAHWISAEPFDLRHMWINDNGVFTDTSLNSGLRWFPINDVTFTPNFTDINRDGWQDILMVSDAGTSSVHLNNQDSTFANITDVFTITDQSGMGGAVGDYDNDGDMDWFVTSIDPGNGDILDGNRLYENDGTGVFSDVTDAAGVRNGYWGWATCFADFNKDSHLDIFMVNGMYEVVGDDRFVWDRYDDDPSRLFISNGDKTFTESSNLFGISDTGQGRGLACLDYDRDGDVDIMVANNGEAPSFFCNHGNNNNFVNIRIRNEAPNIFGIGTKIFVTTGSVTQFREIQTSNNYLSTNPSEAHFGLGPAPNIDEIRIEWPLGGGTVFTNVNVNTNYIITRNE